MAPSDPTPRRAPAAWEDTASRATTAFLGSDAPRSWLGHGEAVVYRVEAEGDSWLLRLHAPASPPITPEFFERDVLESECLWLRALSEESRLRVQLPRPGPDGGYLHEVEGPDGAAVLCSLLHWVPGEHVEGRRSPAQARALGVMIARLHQHARSWTPPSDFRRPRHSPASWQRSLERLAPLEGAGVLTAEQLELCRRVVERADEELAPFALDPERTGLVHADLHGENYVFDGEDPRPLDFGRACYAPWLYDLGECLGGLDPAARRELVSAYEEHLPLAPGDLERLEGYLASSLVEVFGHHAPNADEHDWLRLALPAWTPHLTRYLDREPFLFQI